jgi:hypothetical protein
MRHVSGRTLVARHQNGISILHSSDRGLATVGTVVALLQKVIVVDSLSFSTGDTSNNNLETYAARGRKQNM